jgi:U3 small nucleolar RNA-associated protein 18
MLLKSKFIKPTKLMVTRVKDANHREYNESVVRSIGWHPNGQVMAVSGMDKTLRLFNIDGKRNNKIQSIFFDKTPIYCTQFTPDGSSIYVSGRRKYFHIYDLESGRISKIPGIKSREERSLEQFKISPRGETISFVGNNGEIIIVSTKSNQWIGTLKMNGTLRALDYSKCGERIYSSGSDGEIYEWDVGSRKCIKKYADEGASNNTALVVGHNFVASGMECGIVNLYKGLDSVTPKPMKCLSNLTTRVSGLQFSHDDQLLAMFSSMKKDSLKVVHCGTGKVFAEWPTKSTPLSYVSCVEFSPNSGYISVGNSKGKVLLYRLEDYAYS